MKKSLIIILLSIVIISLCACHSLPIRSLDKENGKEEIEAEETDKTEANSDEVAISEHNEAVESVYNMIQDALGESDPSDPTPTPTLSVEEKAASYPVGTYEEYARNPDTYLGQPIQIQCIVALVEEDEAERAYLVITDSDYTQKWVVGYEPEPGESRILEGDSITVYGLYCGIYTYESVGAGMTSVPSIYAENIVLN